MGPPDLLLPVRIRERWMSPPNALAVTPRTCLTASGAWVSNGSSFAFTIKGWMDLNRWLCVRPQPKSYLKDPTRNVGTHGGEKLLWGRKIESSSASRSGLQYY